MKQKSVKIFDIHMMWLVFINYKQQIHRVFKFLIWNINWKSHLVFITKQVNANFFLSQSCWNLFLAQETFIIKNIISKLFVILCNSFWIHFYRLICLTWHQRKHFWSLFFILIILFLGLLIQQVISHENSLVMVYKLKC